MVINKVCDLIRLLFSKFYFYLFVLSQYLLVMVINVTSMNDLYGKNNTMEHICTINFIFTKNEGVKFYG
ncbi:hypothetical protein D0812_24455 [Vibrio owensii]|uniref:Uncharacterized protein n=1 Tax=Vibrio owensii TaxID=696485 RepID=A0ABM6ZP70_9VIBR|nr:hypothetical protein D0812_24455 [Vibrio owensii]HAS8402784.1 hypothetical protein [Vibrio vulnificus]